MRRFLAYVIMMLTMLCAIVFNTQAVVENKVDAMEYGTGTQLVYSLNKRNISDYNVEKHPDYQKDIQNLEDIDIEGEVMKRLDAAGVRNADVSIVKGNRDQEGYQLRISLSPLSETELNNVKEILSITGDLAIGTEGDSTVYYQAAGEFFDATADDIAQIYYKGTTPYVAIKVKDADSYDKLKSAADEAKKNNASQAHRFYADGSDSDSTEEATKVYLWTNKMLDDTYDRAFGTHETVVMQETKEKVLAEIDVSNWDSDNLLLTLANDTQGNAFTISTARAFVNMLNATDYGFNLEYLYSNSVSATFGSNALTLTYIISGIVLLILCAVMIAIYGLAGITSSLTMLGSTLVSFFLFSLLGFEFSVAALGGLAIIVGLSIMISVNYFERVKAELRKGRDIVKANQEGYHKSFLTSLDVSAIALVSSVFCFLIGTGAYKTFFGVIMIGSIFTFLITNFMDRWMMYWLVKDNVSSHLPFFSFKKNLGQDKEGKVDFASTDKKHFSRKIPWIVLAVSVLGMAISFPVSYVLSGSKRTFFNNASDFASTYTLNITFKDNAQAYERLSTSENYLDYIVEIGSSDYTRGTYVALPSTDTAKLGENGFHYAERSAKVNVVEKTDEENNKYYMVYFTLTIDKDLNKVDLGDGYSALSKINDTIAGGEVSVNNQIIAPMAGDSHGDRDSLVVDSYEVAPTNVTHTTNYLILLGYLISCFAFVYLLIRFGLNVSLAGLFSGSVATTLYLAILSITRIPYSSYTVFGILIALMVLNIFFVPVLGKNREILKERGFRRKASAEERSAIAAEAANKSLAVVLPVVGMLLVYLIALGFIHSSLIGLSISGVVFLLVDVFLLYFFSVPGYLFFANHISFARIDAVLEKRREKRAAKKADKKAEEKKYVGPDGVSYVDDGPHETIIVGVNDFRNRD